MNFSKSLFVAFFIFGSALPAAADWPQGLWQSSPDESGLVVHVRTRACGLALCGHVERAKNRQGYDTPSSAVGSRMLVDMYPQSDGTYQGRFWEPYSNRLLTAKIQVSGNLMRFRNCDGTACKDVVWTRLR